MHWTEGPLCGLDLETDSAQPDEAHLVTAAFGYRPPGGELIMQSWVARPRRPIPAEAAAVHGYSTERAEAEGRDPAAVLREISGALARYWVPSCPLIVFNAPFDLTIIDREFDRLFGGRLEIGGRLVIDPLVIDRQVDKFRPGDRKLEPVAANYGVQLDAGAHDAAVDVAAAMRLGVQLGRRQRWPRGRYGPSVGESQARSVLRSGDLPVLQVTQADWHREQALGLADYFGTSKAVDKIERDHAAGRTTREQADELRATLDQRADDARRHAGHWPMRPRTLAVVH